MPQFYLHYKPTWLLIHDVFQVNEYYYFIYDMINSSVSLVSVELINHNFQVLHQGIYLSIAKNSNYDYLFSGPLFKGGFLNWLKLTETLIPPSQDLIIYYKNLQSIKDIIE